MASNNELSEKHTSLLGPVLDETANNAAQSTDLEGQLASKKVLFSEHKHIPIHPVLYLALELSAPKRNEPNAMNFRPKYGIPSKGSGIVTRTGSRHYRDEISRALYCLTGMAGASKVSVSNRSVNDTGKGQGRPKDAYENPQREQLRRIKI